MHLAALILSIVLGFAMLASGVLKLIRAPRIVALMAAVHVTPPQLTVLGALQVASTIGLIAGSSGSHRWRSPHRSDWFSTSPAQSSPTSVPATPPCKVPSLSCYSRPP